METLEQLKEVIKNAPDGATHYDEDGDYIKFGINYPYWYDGSTWFELESCGSVRSLSDIKLIVELMESNKALIDKINQFDKAITDIGKHIQKSEPSFCVAGVDVGDSQSKIIGYITKLEAALHYHSRGHL